MALGDPKYLLFLSFSIAVFYMIRGGQLRAVWLLFVSYLFYWNLSGLYVSVLALVTGIAFAGGLILDPARKVPRRDTVFAMSCVVLLAPLIAFKYLRFLVGIGAALVGRPLGHLALPEIMLPIGISFFTFAALGYLTDVYLEVAEPERSPLKFALFVAFFPVVTAGPIERAGAMLPQFGLKPGFDSEGALVALRLIFIGLFLKVVCADPLLQAASPLLARPSIVAPIEKLFDMVQYVFYIYADFAGYSLIAIGSAALFGLQVRSNFHQPFLSTSIPEFWRNWHISLSSWVRDYLFMPLRMRMRRNANAGMAIALIVSFLVIGIWHGAGWGFALFGLMHGTLAVASHFTLKRRNAFWISTNIPPGLIHSWRVLVTFALVMLTFVAFGTHTLHDALTIYRDILSLPRLLQSASSAVKNLFSGTVAFSWWTWTIIVMIVAGDVLARRKITLDIFPRPLQLVAYNVGALLIVYGWISAGAAQPFLYYRF